MRRFFVFILAALAIAGCSGNATSVTPPPPAPLGPARGSIVSLAPVTTFTATQMNAGLGLAGQVITALGGAPKCDVALYAIVYNTIGAHGEPATASEGFFVPKAGCKGPFLLVGYGQGTNVVKAQKITDPTSKNVQPAVLAAIFAAHGYAIAATDYLGLGYSNYTYQPYLVIASEASAVIDSMRAARIAAARLHVALDGKVFLTGHSQGGQTALGTQKVIEATAPGEFDLFADSPSSGPYALTRTTLDGLAHPGENAPIYSAYILTAYQKVYGNVYSDPSQTFQQPYAGYIENLLPVSTYAQAADLEGKTLPLDVHRLLEPAFEKAFASNPALPARIDLSYNDLLHAWKPKAPVYLCGGSRDPMVEFKNAHLAYQYFKAEGANVSLMDVNSLMPPTIPITEYHDAVLVLCHTVERVNVLDKVFGNPARVGTWPPGASGRIGPFEP